METPAKYRTETVGPDYYLKQILCQAACPVHTDARGYVNSIEERDYLTGYIRARQPNPFASVCGRVCAAHCEKACRRGKVDAPITIRALKRFLSERYGVESVSHLPMTRPEGQAGRALLSGEVPSNTLTAESLSQLSSGWQKTGRKTPPNLPVAVIGAGPSGLSAAHDLALLGYRVTVFDSAPEPGGMAVLGIPEYRLPRDVLKLEIEEVLGLGVNLKLNTRLGKDFDIARLKKDGFQAIFIAIGAHKDRISNIEGIHLDGVIPAVDFLLNVNLGYMVHLGERVAVVGGGDVAVDAARIAARLGEVYDLLAEGTLATVMDAARNALRLGVREVHIAYRGAREEMRASGEELESALEEGIILHTGLAPTRILGRDGKVAGLETMLTRSEYDEKGRRNLVTVPGSESVLECDSIILAVGQESDLSFIRPGDGIEITRQGTIVADSDTLATNAPGIFAGGDVVFGPRTLIEAVADGHRAARAMDNYLRRGQGKIIRRSQMVPVPADYLPDVHYQTVPRASPAKIPLQRRTGVSEVEMVFDEASALEQARRCLKCHVQTVFNSNLCILCGGCVDVCPRSCLKLVPVEKIEGSGELDNLIAARYGESEQAGEMQNRGTAIIKDETKCIRCGLCYRRCPTGAITMEAFWFEEDFVYSGEPA